MACRTEIAPEDLEACLRAGGCRRWCGCGCGLVRVYPFLQLTRWWSGSGCRQMLCASTNYFYWIEFYCFQMPNGQRTSKTKMEKSSILSNSKCWHEVKAPLLEKATATVNGSVTLQKTSYRSKTKQRDKRSRNYWMAANADHASVPCRTSPAKQRSGHRANPAPSNNLHLIAAQQGVLIEASKSWVIRATWWDSLSKNRGYCTIPASLKSVM